MDWPYRDEPAPLIWLSEQDRAFGGVAQLYAWRRYPDGSWWGYVKWTRQLSAEERAAQPGLRLQARETWVPRERIGLTSADYSRVLCESWDPDAHEWRRLPVEEQAPDDPRRRERGAPGERSDGPEGDSGGDPQRRG